MPIMEAVAFLLQRIGPYHHARLRACATHAASTLTAVEFRPLDAVYAWEAVREEGGYRRVRTHSGEELCGVLDRIRPETVVCVGYSDPEVHQAVNWALGKGVPLVTCSDSTYADEHRFWIKEALKREIVGAFDAALVAGRRAREYLGSLGMRGERCFEPWDVVDNESFARGADAARSHRTRERQRLGLPERYFLCVARFVEKKNLAVLIEAFARYSRKAGKEGWSLVLSGSGPLDAELRARAENAGLRDRVHFAGFLQYSDLPACYGLAQAFVLPSTSDQWGLAVNEAMAVGLPVIVSSRCGCCPELVRENENGYLVEPENTAGLAACLARLAELDEKKRSAMGQRSRTLIEAYTPDAFAKGLNSAISCARANRRAQVPWRLKALFRALAARGSHQA